MTVLRVLLEGEFPTLTLRTLSAAELDQRVTGRFLTTGAPCSSNSQVFRDWPGSQEDVIRWYQLADGSAIGVLGPEEEPKGFTRHLHNKTQQIDWNRLRTCRMVHEAGSFTKAAANLAITQSAVSRQISALEEELGMPLFIRSNSGLVLTETGENFLATINRMWEALELGLAQLNELKEDPTGPIVLTTTQAFGSAWLSSKLSRFHQLYPDLEVRLVLTDAGELNLRQRDADCAIRFRPPTEGGLVRLLVAEFVYGIYASRQYIEEHGAPQSLDDLSEHDLISFGTSGEDAPIENINWLLSVGLPSGIYRRAAVQMNSVYGIYRAIEAGAGLGTIPFYLSERSEELIEVLPDAPRPKIPVYFVYPEELRPSKRIKVLREFVTEEIRMNWSGRVVSKGNS